MSFFFGVWKIFRQDVPNSLDETISEQYFLQRHHLGTPLTEGLHGDHVGWEEQYNTPPLGNEICFHAKLFNRFCHPTWLPCKSPECISQLPEKSSTFFVYSLWRIDHASRICITRKCILVVVVPKMSYWEPLVGCRYLMRTNEIK